jgi:uncharacterized membrane protein
MREDPQDPQGHHDRWDDTIGALLGTMSLILLVATILLVLFIPWPIGGIIR